MFTRAMKIAAAMTNTATALVEMAAILFAKTTRSSADGREHSHLSGASKPGR
jgi:hypothetical protein